MFSPCIYLGKDVAKASSPPDKETSALAIENASIVHTMMIALTDASEQVTKLITRLQEPAIQIVLIEDVEAKVLTSLNVNKL